MSVEYMIKLQLILRRVRSGELSEKEALNMGRKLFDKGFHEAISLVKNNTITPHEGAHDLMC